MWKNAWSCMSHAVPLMVVQQSKAAAHLHLKCPALGGLELPRSSEDLLNCPGNEPCLIWSAQHGVCLHAKFPQGSEQRSFLHI